MFSEERPFATWNLQGFNGSKAILYNSIDSTHAAMKTMAVAGELQVGTLIVANEQNAGKGRHQRTWASPANKNLYFNILIPLDGIPAKNFAQITQIAALTFAEVLNNNLVKDNTKKPSQCDADKITVKWPNDILFGQSKFCGILAEVLFLPNATPALNMGIGINVNSDPSDYQFLNRKVTTLKAIAGKNINREKILQALVSGLERALLQFRAFGIGPWVNTWKQMDQFIGARGTIIVNNNCTDNNRDGGSGVEKKTGRILDMQPDGSLLFETDDGIVQNVYSADLEI